MPRPASKRLFGPLALAVSAIAILAGGGCRASKNDPAARSEAAPRHVNLLVGTYTEGPMSSGKSRGIPVFRFDTTTGELTPLADNDGIRNPSWLVVTPDGRHVFAVNELNGTGKFGEVSAFDFDPSSGKLSFINKVSSEGDDPCHLLFDDTTNVLFVSNYTGGNMVALSTGSTASRKLSPADAETPAVLAPSVPTRSGSHVHSTIKLPGNDRVVVQDLGLNTVTVYPYATDRHTPPARPEAIRLPAGTGPRHLIFNTPGTHAYLVGELNDTITTLAVDDGKLTPAQTVTLGAPVEPGKGTAAAIHLSDDGKFLYASTRNPKNILVVFAVNPTDGRLTGIQTVPSGGKGPREFAIAPGGEFLLVANQQSDAIAVFSRDPETGKIADTGRRIPVGTPVDLKWAPVR